MRWNNGEGINCTALLVQIEASAPPPRQQTGTPIPTPRKNHIDSASRCYIVTLYHNSHQPMNEHPGRNEIHLSLLASSVNKRGLYVLSAVALLWLVIAWAVSLA